MKPIHRPFQYHDSAETAQPGYLKRRFAEYRRRLRDAAADQAKAEAAIVQEQAQKVRRMKGAK